MDKSGQEYTAIGKNTIREEGLGKVTGLGKYAIDLEFPRMLWAKIKRSTRPHAKIVSVDISRANKFVIERLDSQNLIANSHREFRKA